MKKELCIDTYEGALLASKYGYDSIELNSALNLGGLTPNIGLVRRIANNEDIDLAIICMLRNRPAGFLYSNEEFQSMLSELDILLDEKIDGIAFGFLTQNYKIDIEKTRIFVDRIHAKGKIAVFHRAFDNTKDYRKAISVLMEIGVDRLLTSGQSNTAIEGIDIIQELIKIAEDRIEILAGSGLNSINVKDFIKKTDIKYVHSSCKGYKEDNTTNLNVSYRVFNNNKYQITDPIESKRFSEKIDEASSK